MKHLSRAAVLGVSALAATIAAGSASAETNFRHARSAASASIAAAAANRETDDIISGYVTDEGTVSSATASLKVPTLTCGADTQVIFMGLEQVNIAADIILACQEGEPVYLLEAFINELDPVISDEVAPGDTVKLSIEESASETTATVVNGATTVTISGNPDPEPFMLFGTADVSDSLPPEFTTATFSKSKFNGKTLSAKKSTKVNRVDEGIKITTSKLKKGKFTQKFKVLN